MNVTKNKIKMLKSGKKIHDARGLYFFKKGDKGRWSLVTYRNTIHLPITRVDNFKDKMEAIKYLQKIEPETPLISHHGRRLRIPHQEDAWLYWRKWLKKNNLFSALSTKQHCPFWLNPKGYRYGDNYLKEFVKVDAPSVQIPLFREK